MKLIQSQNSGNSTVNSSIIYFALLFILFGTVSVFNFLRPILNLYTIYFELSWAEFQILELFDIINFTFGILLIIFGVLLFISKGFTKTLLIFGGILFILFNILDPSHFLMFWSLLSSIIGVPPVWMQVIPANLLSIYLSVWSLLSISNLILQLFGCYIGLRIIWNSNPRKSVSQYLFLYCWVILISGIILCLQSVLILSITSSWSSLTVAPYILNFASWILMCLVGISGLFFVRNLLKNQIKNQQVIIGQISLISFSVMHLLISFSDFAMKSTPTLIFSVGFALILTIYAIKLPTLLEEKNLQKSTSPSNKEANSTFP